MAWLDERVWCHPKFSDLSDRAGWTWTRGIAYSSGMLTGGVLTAGQQRMIGADTRTRRELVDAELWHGLPDGAVEIHDWDEHNGKRDKRRAADRDRKRNVRNVSAGASAGQSAGASTGTACVDGSEGSDGSEVQEPNTQSPTSYEGTESPEPEHVDTLAPMLRKLALATGARTKHDTDKLARAIKAHRSSESDMAAAIVASTGPGVRDRLAVALSELKKRTRKAA